MGSVVGVDTQRTDFKHTDSHPRLLLLTRLHLMGKYFGYFFTSFAQVFSFVIFFFLAVAAKISVATMIVDPWSC